MPRLNSAAAASTAADTITREPVSARTTPRPKSLGVSKAVIARAHRVGLERAAVKAEQLALAIDTQRPNVSRFGYDHEPHSPSSRQLAEPAAPREWVRAIVSVITDVHAMQVVDRAEVVHGDNHFARIASIAKETSEAQHAYAVGLADVNACRVTALEKFRREAAEAVAALLEGDAAAAAEIARLRAERTKGGK